MVDVGQGKENSALHAKIQDLLKKKNLSKKQLEELELSKKKEEKEIMEELSKTIRAMRDEEEDLFIQEQKRRKEKKTVEQSLEGSVEEEKLQRPPQNQGSNSYSGFGFDANSQRNYDVREPEVYEMFKEIIETPKEMRSSDQKNFLENVSDNINTFKRMDERTLKKEDPNNYVARMQNIISAFYK